MPPVPVLGVTHSCVFLLALPLLVARVGAADDPQHAPTTHDLAVEA